MEYKNVVILVLTEISADNFRLLTAESFLQFHVEPPDVAV